MISFSGIVIDKMYEAGFGDVSSRYFQTREGNTILQLKRRREFLSCNRFIQAMRFSAAGTTPVSNTTQQTQEEILMPKNALYTLIWSSSHQAYGLYKSREEEALYLVP